MTLREHSVHFLQTISVGVVPSSARAYRTRLAAFLSLLGDREPQDIEVADIRAYVEYMQKRGCNSNHIRLVRKFVRQFYRHLSDEKIISEDKLDMFLPRRLQKLAPFRIERPPITRTQHEAIVRRASGGAHKYFWATACIVAWHTGLRASDVSYLRWDHIDWEREIITLIPMKTKRMGKVATIPMEPELAEHLLELKHKPYYESEYVIPDMAGYYTHSPCLVKEQFISIARACGFSKITFHCYRHGFVSRLLDAGVSPIIIASMTAQCVAMVLKYAHISPEAARRGLELARQQMHRARLYEEGIMTPVGYNPPEPALA